MELSPELDELVETLARNNHDLWARRRLGEEWRPGPHRDDAAKETPLLVPYEDLPEAEKEYDRQGVVETLKTIIRLGGRVQAPRSERTGEAAEKRQAYRDKGTKANKAGQSLVAYDVSDEGLKLWPGDIELLQNQALALARMGSAEQARAILGALPASPGDPETAGMLARTFKDIWLRTGNDAELRNSIAHYLKAYSGNPDAYWPGINAATLLWAAGEREQAGRLAQAIEGHCLSLLAQASPENRYWLTATIAEAALVRQDFERARQFYAQARKLAEGDLGNLFSTWRNARIVLRQLPTEIGEQMNAAFRVPRVAVFAGHRVDLPGRLKPRFPAGAEHEVQNAIREELVRMNIGVGFATAAAGSDILFLEALQEMGGKTHVVLPCNVDQFLENSVAECGEEWMARFRAVIRRSEEIIVTSDQRLIMGGAAFRYASDVLDGLAAIRAAQYETSLHHLAVWDGQPGDGPGGTCDAVAAWMGRSHQVLAIDPMKPGCGAQALSGSHCTPMDEGTTRTCAMLFADVKHFSRLSEEQVSVFLREFMAPVAAVASGTEPPPLFQNTWGDGFFFVFARASEAAEFALRLQRCAASIDLAGAGLPEEMGLRIAVHAGPVFEFRDEILGRCNYAGSHVNRAARIEPVTPEGRIYATESFAALATLEAPARFRFNYVGRVPLTKNFGSYSMYDMTPA